MSDWKFKALTEVSTYFTDGDWIESKDQSSDGIRLVQTGNVGTGVYKDRAERARYISEKKFLELGCNEVFRGDCLISRLPDPVGRSCIVPNTGERMISSVDCTIVRFDQNQIVPEYFTYYSQSHKYSEAIRQRITGTTRDRISRSKLGQLLIPIPPLPEQHRIVRILDEAFAAIAKAKANTEENLQNARAVFENYLQSVFTQRGDQWKEAPLGDIAAFRNGINFTKQSLGEQVKVVGVKNFQSNFRVPLDHLETVTTDGTVAELDLLKVGDILTVRSNGNIELIGRSLLATDVPGRISHSGFTIRVRLQNTEMSSEYLCHFMKSDGARRDLIQGGTGTNIKSLNQQGLSALIVPFPPRAQQLAIVNTINEVSSKTQQIELAYRNKLRSIAELKQSLLHQAFSGNL